MSESPPLLLHPHDNTAVVVREMEAGEKFSVAEENVSVAEKIPALHKVAARAIGTGEAVFKYGQIIGFASQAIAPGEWVHVHNVQAGDFERTTEIGVAAPPSITADRGERRFRAYGARTAARRRATISP